MKFYSQIIDKPNSVIKEIKDGTKVVDSKVICVFKDGVLETDDPEVIEELKKHPELFKTDKPWDIRKRWQDTEEGKKLLEKANDLGIKYNGYIRKEYLQKLIKETGDVFEKQNISYKEIVDKAKELNIPTHKRKKEDILNDLKKEVINNG